ncbi:MAG: type I-B CRISPR-associated protein Cas5b [Candidatus Cloacimonadales bacterium]
MKTILVFDIFGDYAHFRKYFTNMSPTTFVVPPRTVLTGIIGALIGISKEENPESFGVDKAMISVQLTAPVNKIIMQINGVKASSISALTMPVGVKRQINYEFVKKPCYRVYFTHQDQAIYEKARNNLINHASVYTLALGSAQCLADYNYIGEYVYSKRTSDNYLLISSMIGKEQLQDIDFTDNNKIQKSVMPNEMQNDRVVTEYREFLYSTSGKPIKAKVTEYLAITDLEVNICVM